MGESERKLAVYTQECAQTIKKILNENKISEYGPGVVDRLMCFLEKYLLDVLEESKCYAKNYNRQIINFSDVKLTLDLRNCDVQQNLYSQKEILELAQKYNERPLPEINQIYGIPLPPQGDYCLKKQNFRFKSLRENAVPELIDVTKHQIFSPMNIKFPNINMNMKGRNYFSQQAAYTLPISNSLCRFASSMSNSFISMNKQKIPQGNQQPQKIKIKPKMDIRNNIENINTMNIDQKKGIIKRSVCMEPQKIVFKPKLLLSLNTNIDNLTSNTKTNTNNSKDCSPRTKKGI